MKRARRLAFVFLLAFCHAGPATACPVCHSETGKQVRAGIFNDDFGSNLLLTLLPFPIILGLAVAVHFGFAPKEQPPDSMPSGSST